MSDITERLGTASCNCGLHALDWTYHNEFCVFRLCHEAKFKIRQLREQVAFLTQEVDLNQEPIAWYCVDDPDCNSAFMWHQKGVDRSKQACWCGKKYRPVYAVKRRGVDGD